MQKIIKITILMLTAVFLNSAHAETQKKQINATGIITKAEQGLTFKTTEGETYYIWTKAIVEKLKGQVGKKVKISAVANATKDGKRHHLVWMRKFEPVKEAASK
jgi:hypothetical protein